MSGAVFKPAHGHTNLPTLRQNANEKRCILGSAGLVKDAFQVEQHRLQVADVFLEPRFNQVKRSPEAQPGRRKQLERLIDDLRHLFRREAPDRVHEF